MLSAQNVTSKEAKAFYWQNLTPSKTKRVWYQNNYLMPKMSFPHTLDLNEFRRQNLKRLEEYYRVQNWKDFYQLIQRMTQLRPSAPIVKAIIQDEGDEAVMGPNNLQKELANIIKSREQELVPTGTYP
jgi:hypothetical protein